ncbi:hypothetical protein [Streptomyces sp. Ru73]|uniref:hypothetical protein n=1 Tax=Streptomyces sp. Ru73 TaxID=2080748 RepID=UPI0015E38FF4|nr:hypothetical protein [Streptomyces sp. Ru73]
MRTGCLVVLAGLFLGVAGGPAAPAHSVTVAGGEDMPWGVVQPTGPHAAGSGEDDMPWG